VDGRLCHTLEEHTGWVKAVAVTPDGDKAISASDDGTLRIWDLSKGQVRHLVRGEVSVGAVVLTSDGSQAISAWADGSLRVLDLESGQLRRTLKGAEDWVSTVAVTRDGTTVVSAMRGGKLEMSDLGSGRLFRTVNGHDDIIVTVASGASCVGWYLGRVGFREFHQNDEGCKDGEVTRCGEGAILAGGDPAIGGERAGSAAVLQAGTAARASLALVAAEVAGRSRPDSASAEHQES